MTAGSRDRYIFSDVISLPGVETLNLDITDIDAVRQALVTHLESTGLSKETLEASLRDAIHSNGKDSFTNVSVSNDRLSMTLDGSQTIYFRD